MGQLLGLDPAPAGVAVAPELDVNIVLQGVAQLEDNGFDGSFGLLVHRVPLLALCQPAGLLSFLLANAIQMLQARVTRNTATTMAMRAGSVMSWYCSWR